MTEPSDAPDTVAADAFQALLRRLDAGDLAYETLRQRLIRFFRVAYPAEDEALADIALDRLARRIHEGVDVAHVPLYALGIARKVLQEARARASRRHASENDPTFAPSESDADDAGADDEAAMSALSGCLDAAGAANRALILAYYGADGGARIRIRRRLAAELGISLNALRNRALRLRETLEGCVRRHLGSGSGP